MIVSNMKEHPNKPVPNLDFSQQRREKICELLRQKGRVAVAELAKDQQVQPITIRRDLDELAAKGLLIRVRGGAVANLAVRLEFTYAQREKQCVHEKRAIAKRASEMIQPGQTLILDTGTTTQLLARALIGRTDLQVVTNSMIVAYELRGAMGIEVVLLGGQARRGGFELVGPIPQRLLGDLHADLAFLGADAIDPKSGFYTTDLGVSQLEELMILSAGRAVVLADASKIGRRGFARYATFEQIDTWITCGTVPAEARRPLRRQSTQIIQVPRDKER